VPGKTNTATTEVLTVQFDRSESAALRLLARHEEMEPPEFVRSLVRAAIGFAESLGRAELALHPGTEKGK
jgi:hypothetical protein